MRFTPQKSVSVSSLASVIDAGEPSVVGGNGDGSIGAGACALAGAAEIPIRDKSHIANVPTKSDTSARIREQLDGICTLRGQAIEAALTIKGSFGEGFGAYFADVMRKKPELALGFLKPLLGAGLDIGGAAGPERAPILIIQSTGPVNVEAVERAA